jgi:hypothetical protein
MENEAAVVDVLPNTWPNWGCGRWREPGQRRGRAVGAAVALTKQVATAVRKWEGQGRANVMKKKVREEGQRSNIHSCPLLVLLFFLNFYCTYTQKQCCCCFLESAFADSRR